MFNMLIAQKIPVNLKLWQLICVKNIYIQQKYKRQQHIKISYTVIKKTLTKIFLNSTDSPLLPTKLYQLEFYCNNLKHLMLAELHETSLSETGIKENVKYCIPYKMYHLVPTHIIGNCWAEERSASAHSIKSHVISMG